MEFMFYSNTTICMNNTMTYIIAWYDNVTDFIKRNVDYYKTLTQNSENSAESPNAQRSPNAQWSPTTYSRTGTPSPHRSSNMSSTGSERSPYNNGEY